MPISRNVVKKKPNIQPNNSNLSSTPQRRASTGGSLLSKQCRYCDRKFSKAEHLKRHERSHTGERPYTCSRCQKSFSRSDVLIRHLKNHPQPPLPSTNSSILDTGKKIEKTGQPRADYKGATGSIQDKIHRTTPSSVSVITTTTNAPPTSTSSHPILSVLDHHLSGSDQNHSHHFQLQNNQHHHHNPNDTAPRPAHSLQCGLDHLATLASWQDYGCIGIDVHDSHHDISSYGPKENWEPPHCTLTGCTTTISKRNVQIDPNLDPRLAQPENLFVSSEKKSKESPSLFR